MANRKIVLLGTGGTIAGTSSGSGNAFGYTAGQVSVEGLVASVPLLPRVLAGRTLVVEQVAQVDSKDMDDAGVDEVDRCVVHQQPQSQGWVLRQQSAQRGSHMARKSHGGRQAQLAAGCVARGCQLGPCLLGRRTHGCAACVVALAGVGQRQLARGAVQQRDAAIALELAHLLAHGRCAHAQRPGGATHRTVLHHGRKNGHAFEVIHGVGALIVKCNFKQKVFLAVYRRI